MYPTYNAQTGTNRYLLPKNLSYLLTIELRKHFWEQKEKQSGYTTQYNLDYVEIHNAAKILNRPVLLADAYEVEEALDRSLSYSLLDGNWLKFGIGLQSYMINLEQVLEIINIKEQWCFSLSRDLHLMFNAAYMIRYGYTLKEEKAKYLIITSQHGVRHYTTSSSCSCHQGNAECAHMMLATHYLENRKLWQRLV